MSRAMQVRELAVPDVFEFTPKVFPDRRGTFVSPFQEEPFVEAVGHPMRLAQSNHSHSSKDCIRGVHWADVPPGQAKYVYCAQGAVLDVVVDIRVGSPAFGAWDATRLDQVDFRAVYVPEGVAHAYLALTDSVVSYLCSTAYNPGAEHGINPFDAELDLPWPADLEPLVSDKDLAAPTLAQARAAGLLPSYTDCLAYYDKLRS